MSDKHKVITKLLKASKIGISGYLRAQRFQYRGFNVPYKHERDIERLKAIVDKYQKGGVRDED